MSLTLYTIEEGKVAPRVPDFLRGKFFELQMEVKHLEGEDDAFSSWEYAGWIHFREDGTVVVGEPGA